MTVLGAFDWTAIAAVAAAVAALGSILAAAATVYLGNETRQSVQLTNAEIEGGLRALVVDVPATAGRPIVTTGPDGSSTCVVPFRNVGVSAAIIDHVSANSTGPWVDGGAMHHALPPGETSWASFTLAEGVHANLAVEIAYTDLTGGQPTRTHLTARDGDDGWRVVGVALYDGADGHPRARTGELFPGSMGQEYRQSERRHRLFGDITRPS